MVLPWSATALPWFPLPDTDSAYTGLVPIDAVGVALTWLELLLSPAELTAETT